MNIHNLASRPDSIHNELDYLIMLESHLTYLREHGNVRWLMVTEQQNYKYEGDFFGLLDDLNIDKKFHHLVLRVNNYSSSNDFRGDKTQILIPDLDEMSLLNNIYQTKNN